MAEISHLFAMDRIRIGLYGIKSTIKAQVGHLDPAVFGVNCINKKNFCVKAHFYVKMGVRPISLA